MGDCPKCDGIGSICLNCNQAIDECECEEDSMPCTCDACKGAGDDDEFDDE